MSRLKKTLLKVPLWNKPFIIDIRDKQYWLLKIGIWGGLHSSSQSIVGQHEHIKSTLIEGATPYRWNKLGWLKRSKNKQANKQNYDSKILNHVGNIDCHSKLEVASLICNLLSL